MLIEGVEVDTDDVAWLADELIMTGRYYTAGALIQAGGASAETVSLTVIDRFAIIGLLEDAPTRLVGLRSALVSPPGPTPADAPFAKSG